MADVKVPEPYAGRLAALRESLKKAGLTGLLVTRPENRRYLSGYTASDGQIDETSGFLLVGMDSQVLFTDFRYMIQAGQEAKGYEVLIYSANPAQTVAMAMENKEANRVGFEEDFITVRFHRLLTEQIVKGELRPQAGLVEKLRSRKDKTEIAKISKALHITEAALRETLVWLRPGVTEKEAAHFLEEKMLEHGAEGTAFDTIVASGPNAALPHAQPGRRKIREGEAVVFDCGAKADGYGADMTRTVILGEPKAWVKKIYALVRQAQLAGIAAVAPGVMSDKVDDAARKIIEVAGYGENFGHALGHGVGLATHEAPSLSKTRPSELAPGMIITVEPGIYLKDKGGVRLEEMVLVTDKGARVLNKDDTFYRWE